MTRSTYPFHIQKGPANASTKPHRRPNQIEAALSLGRTYGFKSIQHVQGIILKNRATVLLPRLDKIQLEGSIRSPNIIRRWAASRYPDVALLKDLYCWRIDRAIERGKPLTFAVKELTYNKEPAGSTTVDY